MATLDEVISQMSEEDYYNDPIQFVIDSDLRIISIPRRGVVAGVVGDKNVNRVNFQMPRYYNGIDMSKFTTRVNYVNAKSIGNFYMVDDLKVENDSILFTWLIDSDVVAYAGKIIFSINMIMTDEKGMIKQAFNTSNAGSLNVLDGIKVDDHISPEEQMDILSKLEQEASKYMDNVIKNATEIKTELIAANANAIQTKNDLDETNAIASKLNSSLKDKVEDGIQSDWNQNDDTAVNYIKNRPFYTYYVEDTVNYNPNSGSIMLEGFIPFKEGDNVTVKIDGIECSKNVGCIQHEDGPTMLYIGDNPINEESFNWCIISVPSEDESYIFVAKEPHSITYKKKQFHTIDSRYIPVSANAFRSEYDVFGSSITTSPEIETTRANQYPNKKTLTDLSVETFNKMLDGSITIPDYITVNRDIASVSVYQDKIGVRWSSVDFYYQNKVGLAGICHRYFDAIICEDDANPGTIISKYALVTIYDKKIS